MVLAPFMFTVFDKEDVPSRPHAVLSTHVVLKGFQAGAVLGLVFSPLYWATRGKLRGRDLLVKSMRSSMYGSAIGATATSAMLAGKYSSFGKTWEEWDDNATDRAFRLKFHQTQQRNDVFSIAGMLLSGVSAPVLSLPVVPTMASGLAVGCFIHFITSGPAMMDKNQTWADKKKAWKDTYQKIK